MKHCVNCFPLACQDKKFSKELETGMHMSRDLHKHIWLVELVYKDKKRKSSLEMQRKPPKFLKKNYLEFLHHLWKMFHDSLKMWPQINQSLSFRCRVRWGDNVPVHIFAFGQCCVISLELMTLVGRWGQWHNSPLLSVVNELVGFWQCTVAPVCDVVML